MYKIETEQKISKQHQTNSKGEKSQQLQRWVVFGVLKCGLQISACFGFKIVSIFIMRSLIGSPLYASSTSFP